MEFLGRQTMVEIPMTEVRSLRDVRQGVVVPPPMQP